VLLAEAEQEYRWAHGVAHARSVTDEVAVSTSTSDPTGNVVLSKRGTRKACEGAARDVKDAQDALKAAIKGLSAALRLVDPKPRFEPLRYKADATRKDIAQARAAQLRRRHRGEEVPE
jgi:hypothetical protein